MIALVDVGDRVVSEPSVKVDIGDAIWVMRHRRRGMLLVALRRNSEGVSDVVVGVESKCVGQKGFELGTCGVKRENIKEWRMAEWWCGIRGERRMFSITSH